MITEELINNANEKVKSILKIKNYGVGFIFCVSIVFGIILLYFIFKFKNNLEHRKDNISFNDIVTLGY